jgi:TPR repeat protein
MAALRKGLISLLLAVAALGIAGIAPADTHGAGRAEADGDVRLEVLHAAEAEAREAAIAAWDAAEAADVARAEAEARLVQVTEAAREAREAAQQAIAALSAAMAARQEAEAALVAVGGETPVSPEPPGDTPSRADMVAQAEARETAMLAAVDAARRSALAEAGRLSALEAARAAAAEEAAARQAALSRAGRREPPGIAEALERRSRAVEAARRAVAAEERRAAEVAAARAALSRCIATAGPPSAEIPVSEDAQRAAFRALAAARQDCADAARALPGAGAALFHLATIAQASGEHRQAVRLYEQAAGAGVAAALTRLGDYYNFGIRPVREDVDRAVAYYEEAVAAGDAAGAATLGMMHRLGRGVARDPVRMIALMQRAADADYHFAQFRLARTFLNGDGVAASAQEALGLPDARAAVPLLAAAARAGNLEAAYDLADLYSEGAPGVPANPASRFRWVDFLAEAGEPAAIAERAFLTELGEGTPRDPAAAARGYVAALETGQVDPETMRGTVDGAVPRWDEETAVEFQRILQARGFYRGRLDGQIGPMSLEAARALAGG